MNTKLNPDYIQVINRRRDADETISYILDEHEYVAVDMEGVNLGDGPVTLVQIAVMPHSTRGEERMRVQKSLMSPFGPEVQGLDTSLNGFGSFYNSGPVVRSMQNTSTQESVWPRHNYRDRSGSGASALSLGSQKKAPSTGLLGEDLYHSGQRLRTRSTGTRYQSEVGHASAYLDDGAHAGEKYAHPEIYLFDIMENSSLIWSLEPLFASVDTVKVIHDARGDVRALDNFYGIRMRRLFDTQVADLLIQEFREGAPPRRSSLNSIARMYGGVVNPYKEMVRELYYDRGYPYYDQRPLTMEMLYQAAHDVHSLVPNVYQNQIDLLKPGSEVWNRFINRMRGMVRVGY